MSVSNDILMALYQSKDEERELEELREDYATSRAGSVIFYIQGKMYNTGGDIKLTKGDSIGIHFSDAPNRYYRGEFLGVKSFYIYIINSYGTEIGLDLGDERLSIEPLD